jgi:hypothetical protein
MAFLKKLPDDGACSRHLEKGTLALANDWRMGERREAHPAPLVGSVALNPSDKGAVVKLPRRRFLKLACVAAGASALPRPALALDYPTPPVRFVVGFPHMPVPPLLLS